MTRIALSFCLSLLCTIARGEPCIGQGFDIPFPQAVDTRLSYVDVPSAIAPSYWQEGKIEGLFYHIYPNNSANLIPDKYKPQWSIFTDCQDTKKPCQYKFSGSPPENAKEISIKLGACLRGETVEPARAIEAYSPVENCGLAPEADPNPMVTLQKLLTMLGQNPGDADGFYGAKTETALRNVFPDLKFPIDVKQAINLANQKLCAAKEKTP